MKKKELRECFDWEFDLLVGLINKRIAIKDYESAKTFCDQLTGLLDFSVRLGILTEQESNSLRMHYRSLVLGVIRCK